MQDFAYERSPAKENAFYNAFETLLVVHGVDPDCLVEKRKFLYQEMRFPHRPLDRMLEELSSCIKRLDGDYYYIDPQPESEPTRGTVGATIAEVLAAHAGAVELSSLTPRIRPRLRRTQSARPPRPLATRAGSPKSTEQSTQILGAIPGQPHPTTRSHGKIVATPVWALAATCL